MKTWHLTDVLLAILVFVVVSFSLSGTKADPDLWGHVRFGQDILATHAIPRHDPYSFTSDRPWINHEWLAEVLMASAYQWAGSPGLIALKWVLTIGALWLTWRSLRQAGVFPPAAVGLLLVATLGVHHLLTTLRPQLFSVPLFAIELSLLNAIGRGRPELLLWMPVLFALWANLHGGWIVGAGVLALWGACSVASRALSPLWAVAGSALALVGTLATPYGFDLWWFLWETVGFGRVDIEDWQPLIRIPSLLIPWTLASLLAALAWKWQGQASILRVLPPIALGVLALRVVRLGGFFALATVILLAPSFAAVGPRRLPLSRRPTRSDKILVGALAVVGLVSIGIALSHHGTCVTITDAAGARPWTPEAEAVTFFQINQLQGRLLSYFDYGEIAIWHTAPKLRVSYDGRRETVYSSEIQNRHRRFYMSASEATYAKTLNADYVWLPRWLPVNQALQREGWTAIFRGSRSVIYGSREGSYRQPTPWNGPRCFPGP